MVKARFLKYLRGLNEKELVEFRDYLFGLYQQQETLIKLFEYIIKDAPLFSNKEFLNMEKAFLYLNQKPLISSSDRKLISNHLNKLTNLLKDFLALKALKENPLDANLLLIKGFFKRNMTAAFQHQLERFDKLLIKKNPQVLQKKLELNQLRYYADPRKNAHYLDEALVQLEDFYLITKLKLSCEVMLKNRILNKKPDSSWIQSIPTHQLARVSQIPTANIYLLAFELSEQRNHDQLITFKNLIYTNYNQEYEGEQSMFFGFLINYFSYELKSGKMEYKALMNELYRFCMDKKILIQNGKMSVTLYHNMVNGFCAEEAFLDAKTVIKNFTTYLAKEEKEEAIRIANGLIYFFSSQFKKATEEVWNVSAKNKIFDLRKRWIILKSFYELKEFQSLKAHCKAFEMYLKRVSSFSEDAIDANFALIKFTKKLVLKKDNTTQLEHAINTAPNIYFKEWLLKKVKEKKFLFHKK